MRTIYAHVPHIQYIFNAKTRPNTSTKDPKAPDQTHSNDLQIAPSGLLKRLKYTESRCQINFETCSGPCQKLLGLQLP